MLDLASFRNIPNPATPFPASLETAQQRADASSFIQDLIAPLGVELLWERVPQSPDHCTNHWARHPELSAYFCLEHGVDHRGFPGAPPIYWRSTSRALRALQGAWDTVHANDPHSAVTHPLGLHDLPSALWFGFRAAFEGAAFKPPEEPMAP